MNIEICAYTCKCCYYYYYYYNLLLFDLLVTLTIFATYWFLEKIYPRKIS